MGTSTRVDAVLIEDSLLIAIMDSEDDGCRAELLLPATMLSPAKFSEAYGVGAISDDTCCDGVHVAAGVAVRILRR